MNLYIYYQPNTVKQNYTCWPKKYHCPPEAVARRCIFGVAANGLTRQGRTYKLAAHCTGPEEVRYAFTATDSRGNDVLNKEAWTKRFKAILSLDSHPGHIAAGFAVGVFISFTPFFTFHTLIAIAAAFILRLNKLTCITGSWVNTPVTVLPVLGLSFKLGRILRGLPPEELHVRGLEWHQLQKHAASLLLGSSILGFVAAVAAYFICYYLVVRFRRKDESLAELTREMEATGEELE